MHAMPIYVTFGGRRGWNEALPGLDWERFVLAASAVVLVHFVLAGVAREETRSIVLGVGLGSEWGRNGLERVVFSLVFVMNQ